MVAIGSGMVTTDHVKGNLVWNTVWILMQIIDLIKYN